MKRLIAIGDIHGCYDQLIQLVDEIQPTQEDTLVFLGDYIDRGPKTFELIDYLVGFKKDFPNTVFLKGNHELMMEYGLKEGDKTIWYYNGGRQTKDSYDAYLMGDELVRWDALPPSHQEFFDNLKLYEKIGNFIFTHAGLVPGVPLEDQCEDYALWIRDRFLLSKDPFFNYTIVHGHTVMTNGRDEYHTHFPNKICLDTGCVYGYHLTAMDVLTREEWKVLGYKAKINL